MSQTQTTLLLMVNADYNHVQGHILSRDSYWSRNAFIILHLYQIIWNI